MISKVGLHALYHDDRKVYLKETARYLFSKHGIVDRIFGNLNRG